MRDKLNSEEFAIVRRYYVAQLEVKVFCVAVIEVAHAFKLGFNQRRWIFGQLNK